MADYSDGYWQSEDDLRLHYRDYAGPDDRPPLLCIPGLTRNARDFEPLAAQLAGQWRMICVDLRGRAESASAKDASTYEPRTYVRDIQGLIAALGLDRFVLVGTSLGGLIGMLMAPLEVKRYAGMILNDIGPTIEKEGRERIRENTGTGGSQPTWMHAARHFQSVQGSIYPDFTLHDWLAMAKRICRLNNQGRIVPDYDSRIAEMVRAPVSPEAIAAGEAAMWSILASLRNVPTLILRGERSDVLGQKTARAMAARLGQSAELLVVPRVGHAPVLDEPVALEGIARLLDRVTGTA